MTHPLTRQELERLSLIVNWRHELLNRIARHRLKFELVGAPPEEDDALADEVKEYKRVVALLHWLSSGRET